MPDSLRPYGRQPVPFFMVFSGRNTGKGCHALLWRILSIQGSNSSLFCLLLWQACSLPLTSPGKPTGQQIVNVSLKHEMLGILAKFKSLQFSYFMVYELCVFNEISKRDRITLNQIILSHHLSIYFLRFIVKLQLVQNYYQLTD